MHRHQGPLSLGSCASAAQQHTENAVRVTQRGQEQPRQCQPPTAPAWELWEGRSQTYLPRLLGNRGILDFRIYFVGMDPGVVARGGSGESSSATRIAQERLPSSSGTCRPHCWDCRAPTGNNPALCHRSCTQCTGRAPGHVMHVRI